MYTLAGLSSLLFTIIVFTRHYTASTASRWTSFSRLVLDKERLSSPYKSMGDTSGLQCPIVCGKEEGCRAFNHNGATGSCELIDSSANEKQETEDRNWTVFEKDVRYTVPTEHLTNVYDSPDIGGWTPEQLCPNRSLATAYTMKIMPFKYIDIMMTSLIPGDNTALTAVRLTCKDQHGNVTGTVTSGEANCEPGKWGATTSCSTQGHYYLTSFRIQYDTDGVEVFRNESLDQTAINYAAFRCRDLENKIAEYEIVAPPGNGHSGTWRSWSSSCPANQAVCGIKTRIKDDKPDCQGVVDMKLLCCGVAYG